MNNYKPVIERLINAKNQLIDGTDEIFELDLAIWEQESFNEHELIKRSAYFKSINGQETNHYKFCNYQNLEEIHKDSSFRTKVYFLEGKYSRGYSTHSLFPYRGKFHPQLIRGIINILKIQPGSTILDPMAGSGTVSVEANLLGIDSISVDLSPFCVLMSKVKTFSLDINEDFLKFISKKSEILINKFNKEKIPDFFNHNLDDELRNYYEIALLAYLDTVGFSKRSEGSIESLFPRVLKRYILTIINNKVAKEKLNLNIGKSQVYQGNATNLSMEADSVDAIITSPPYSFAIDYLKNDQPQLEYMGVDFSNLKENMIGLQGKGIGDKLDKYFYNINLVLQEMRRVTKKNSPIVIIIGSNEVQTKGIKLECKVKELAENSNLILEFEMVKPIKGLQNTMKSEHILFFKNGKK